MLAEIAKEHNLYVISDEVYRGFAYDGLKGISMGAIQGVSDRVIIIESVSFLPGAKIFSRKFSISKIIFTPDKGFISKNHKYERDPVK